MENKNSSMPSQSVISISDRFKTVAFWGLISLFCAATGCSEDYNSRLAGDYIGNQTGEMIRLKEDGTFVAGKKSGTWSFNGGSRIEYKLSSGEEYSDQLATITNSFGIEVDRIVIDGQGALTNDTLWTRHEKPEPKGKLLNTFVGHAGNVNTVTFSPDGKQIASGAWDSSVDGSETIKLWDLPSGRLRKTIFGHNGEAVQDLQFSLDGNRLYSGSDDDTIKIWDVATGKEFKTLKGHNSDVWSIELTSDGKHLYSGSPDGTLKKWDVETGEELDTFDDLASWSIALSPNEKQILSSRGSTIKLWELETGGELLSLTGHESMINSVSFSPNGRLIVSGSQDKTIRIWDLTSEVEILKITDNSYVHCVSFSPDGLRIASGNEKGTVQVWDVNSGEELEKFSDHHARVYDVTFSPDGKTLASASSDRTIKIWDVSE